MRSESFIEKKNIEVFIITKRQEGSKIEEKS